MSFNIFVLISLINSGGAPWYLAFLNTPAKAASCQVNAKQISTAQDAIDGSFIFKSAAPITLLFYEIEHFYFNANESKISVHQIFNRKYIKLDYKL